MSAGLSPAGERAGALLACALALVAAGGTRAERVPVGRALELRAPAAHAHAVLARDVARTGRALARAPAQVPSRRWVARLPFRRLHPPLVLADGTLVVAGSEGVVALSPDGSERWRRTTPGIAFEPTLTPEGEILLVTDAHELLRMTTEGEPRDTAKTAPKVAGEPLVLADGTGFAGSRDGRLLAFAPGGALLREIPTTHRGTVRLAALGDGLVAAAGEDVLLSVVSLHVGLVRAVTFVEPLAAGPIVGDDGTLWVVGQLGTLWGVEPGGEPRALDRLAARGRRPPPAIGLDGHLRFGDDALRCITPSGSERWRRSVDGAMGPITLDADDSALFLTTRGTLHVFTRDGTLRWHVGIGEGADVRPVLASDGTIYVATPSGRVSAWR